MDNEHLEHFKKFLGAINTEIKRNDKTDNGKTYELVYFSISDEKMVSDLIDKGCIPNKTYGLTFPNENILPKELIFHFIRGFFDGDGSIYTDDLRHRLCINFTSTADMLNSIKNIIGKENLSLENKGNYSVLHIDGNKQVKEIMNQIYKDSYNEIELTRKKNKFINFYL